jgi:hypothetical protein
MQTAELTAAVTYFSTKGDEKAALVIGTPESTRGRIAEGQVGLKVFNPLNGHSYYRRAQWNEALGGFQSAEAARQAAAEQALAGAEDQAEGSDHGTDN